MGHKGKGRVYRRVARVMTMEEPEADGKGEDRKLRDVWSTRGMNTRSNICRPAFRLPNIDGLSVDDV